MRFGEAEAVPIVPLRPRAAQAPAKSTLPRFHATAGDQIDPRTMGENATFRIPLFGFRGTPTGVDIFRVLESGVLPVMDVGLAGRDGGQIGAGVIRAPRECFERAAARWREVYPGS